LIPEESTLQLLAELDRLALAEPALEEERAAAWEEFRSKGEDGGSPARFREWFLLQRPSEALGAPPAQVFAPTSIDADSAWERLLDSFLGIFESNGEPVDGMLALTDLWSGRGILVEAPGGGDWVGDDALVLGRFVATDAGTHVPLPGLLTLRAPGLKTALDRDLGEIRARNPRARLSQVQCEHLFVPYFPAKKPPESVAELESRIVAALHGVPDWNLERLLKVSAEHGVPETLDDLAFHTGADLESLRVLLPVWIHRLAADAATEPAAPLAERVDAANALQEFDLGRLQGQPLDELFAKLETDLGLDPGASREGGPDEVEPDPEVRAARSFGIWIETYAWEREAEGRALLPHERDALETFGNFLDETGFGAELHRLDGSQPTAFYLAASNASELTRRRHALGAFLRWAQREQDAPLADYLDALEGELGTRIEQIQDCNRELAADSKGPAHTRARVVATQPLRVLDPEGEEAEVSGLRPRWARLPKTGDVLVGRWREGAFELGALLPAQLFPEPSDAS